MFITLKMALAMMKRKKIQNILTGMVMMLIATLLYMGLSMMNQSSSFSMMFDRANATENLLLLSKTRNDIENNIQWWENREEVSGSRVYDAHMTTIEYELLGNTESEIVLMTEYLPSSEWDIMYETDDTVATIPRDNQVLINYNYAKNRNLAVGDKLSFSYKGETYEFVVSGFVVDPHFSNPFNTPDRCFIAPNYFEEHEIKNDTVILGIKYHNIKEVDDNKLFETYSKDIQEVAKPMYINYSTFEKSYNIIITIIASILLTVSIFIFLIVFFVIRSSIRNIVLQQYKEIGVKKALGYTNKQIRNSLLWVYILIGSVASVAGVILGLPIRNQINKGISYDIQVGQNAGVDIYTIITIGVMVGLICTFTLLATIQASKIKPTQAIKYGMPERKVAKNKFDITKTKKLPLSIMLSIKQLLSNGRRTVTTTLIITLLIYVALTICNIGYTFSKSEHFAGHLVGLKIADYTVVNHADEPVVEVIKQISTLEGADNVVFYKYTLSQSVENLEGDKLAVGGQVIYGNFPEDGIILAEGRQPISNQEIIISSDLAKKIGKTTGDYLTIYQEDKEVTYLISGIHNTVFSGGISYTLLEKEIPSTLKQNGGFYWVYSLGESVIIEEINQRIKALLDEEANVSRYDSNIKNILSTMESFPIMIKLLLFVFVVICGVIIMNFTIMDINNSTRAYGIMKAIGYSNSKITKILVIRTMLVTLFGTAIGFIGNLLTLNSVMKAIFSVTPFASIELPVIFDVLGSATLILLFFAIAIISTLIPARKIATVSPKQLISE